MKRKRRILAMLLAAAMCVLPMEIPMVIAGEDVQSEGAEPVLIYDSSPMEVGETRAVKLAIPETCTVEVTEISPNLIYTYNESTRTLCITATYPGEAEVHLTLGDEVFQGMTEVVSLTVEGVPELPTDAIPEVTMGIPFPLYNVPLADYQAGKIKVSFRMGSDFAELLAEDGAEFLQLVGKAPGTVMLQFSDENGDNLPPSKDAVWRDNPEGFFNIVEDGGTGTRTPHGSYMIRVGQTQQIHFWDAQTMTADAAKIEVTEGEYLISYNYQPGNDFLNVTGRAEGKAVLNIYADDTDEPAQVIFWVAGENEPTEPMTDPIEPAETDPVMTTTTTPDESWRAANTTMTLPIRETVPVETPYVDPVEPTDPLDILIVDPTSETTAVSTGSSTTTTTTTTTTVMTNQTTSSSKETTATTVNVVDEVSGDGAWMLDEAFGDLNEDGFVNAQDGADILMDAAEFGASGTHSLQGERLDRADTNRDGNVNAIDAGVVLVFSAESGADPNIPKFPEYIHARLQKPELHGTHTASFIKTSAYKAFGLQAQEHCLNVITSRHELDAYLAQLRTAVGDASVEYQWLVRDSAAYGDETFFRYDDLLVMTAAEDGHTYQVVHDITADKDNAWTVHVNREIYAQPVGSNVPTYIHYMRVNKAIEWANGIAVEFTDIVDPTISDTTPEVPETADVHVFGVQYVSVSLPDEPETAVITTPDALQAYFSGVHTWDTYGIGTPADEIAAQYDQYWFRQSSLVIVPVHVSDCDDTCRLRGMTYDAQTDTLDVQAQIIREGVCEAEGDWLICIETDAVITDKTTVNVQTEEIAPDDAAFRAAFYHRINGSSLSSREPIVFTDYDTLQAAIKDPSDRDFGVNSEPLTSILPRYDGGYFENHALIVVPIEASSGSYWFNVTDVTMNDNGVTVCIDKFSPEVVTCDMAYWYVFVNVSKPVADAAANGVEVKMTEQALGSIW